MALSNDNDFCVPDQISAGCLGITLTLHRELVWFGNRMIIENLLKVNNRAGLFLLCPWSMAALHSDVHAHLGCWGNLPIYTGSR